MPSLGWLSVTAVGFQCCAVTSGAATPPDFFSDEAHGAAVRLQSARHFPPKPRGCAWKREQNTAGTQTLEEAGHRRTLGHRCPLSASWCPVPAASELGVQGSGDRSACPAQLISTNWWNKSQTLSTEVLQIPDVLNILGGYKATMIL